MNHHYLWLIAALICSSNSIGFSQDLETIVDEVVVQAEQLRLEENDSEAAMELLASTAQRLEAEGYSGNPALVPLYHKLGVNYYYQGNQLAAEPYASKALEGRIVALGRQHLDVARSYFLRGAIHTKMQVYRDAKSDIGNAIDIMESLLADGQSEDSLRLINMYDEYVDLNVLLRNQPLALLYWERSYQFYSQSEADFAPNLADLYMARGNMAYTRQAFQQAIPFFEEAARYYRQLTAADDSYDINLASAISSKALIQTQLGQYDQAFSNYQKAQDLLSSAVLTYDIPFVHQELAVVYNNLLELSGLTRNYEQVTHYYEQAKLQNLAGWGTDFHPNQALVHRDRAQIAMDRGRYQQALVWNQKSLQGLVPDYQETDPLAIVSLQQYVVTNKIAFLETIRQRAVLLTSIYDQNPGRSEYLEAAHQHYLTLDTVITQIRQSYNVEGAQFDLIENSFPIYDQAIATALRLYELSEEDDYLQLAFHFAARNKALLLLDGRQHNQVLNSSAIDPSLLAQEKAFKRSIYQLEGELYTFSDQATEVDNYQNLKDSLFTLRREHQKLMEGFERNYPVYYQNKYGLSERLSLNSIQQDLEEGEVLLEYFIGAKQIYIFYVTSGDYGFHQLALPATFNTSVAELLVSLQQKDIDQADFLKRSNQIYNWVLPNAVTQRWGNVDHLIIIPDGVLLRLPFDILVQDVNEAAIASQYLLKTYSISYAYSSRLLTSTPGQERAPQLFAGFGLEYDDYTLEAISAAVNNPIAESRSLGKLVFSDAEVQEIAALLDGQYWINEDATLAAFCEQAPHYAILHLAAHGLLNEEYPLNSALVFTKQSDSTEFMLRAADLYDMQLNAEMVVLSACNTGAGTLYRGEGVRSLARAFAYAGCPSTIASLWSASDEPTKEILVRFYQYLKEGMDKSTALRQAKIDYLDSTPPAYASPFYWAHLAVIGDHHALSALSTSNAWWQPAVAVVFLLVLCLFYAYRRKGK
ncbi:MAG: CHAT domain-containing tetratricopeptide repeat protein [Bacteroidota bacterium]